MRVKFFIIRPPLCKHEGDEMSKILYYYPQDETDQKKLQAIGLGQGKANSFEIKRLTKDELIFVSGIRI